MLLRSVVCGLLALAAAAPAAAARQRDRCNTPSARTVALNPQLRVFSDRDTLFYYACVRRTGRRTLLWEQDDIYVNGRVQGVAGRYVAYTVADTPGCKNDCPPGVTTTVITSVTDATNGRTRELHDPSVRSVRLARSGALAWISGSRPDDVLSVWKPGSRIEILASGGVGDVEVSKGRLRWSDDAGRHSAPFA